MIVLAATSIAHAAPAPEEIVVYADDFARWDHTRWWVRTELVLPSALELASRRDEALRTHALQVRAIVACEKDARLSARRWEVSCTFEQIGLLVTTRGDWATEGGRARVQRVLDEVDARLTGARVQMQVDDEGGIVAFDLEGLEEDTPRDREILEHLRTLGTLVMAGFHLRIPEHAQLEGQWLEKHTELMDIPSLTAARGSTRVLHEATPIEGGRLVQSVGRGTVAVAVSTSGTDPFARSKLVGPEGHDTTTDPTRGIELEPPPDSRFSPQMQVVIGPIEAIVYPPPPVASATTEANLQTTSTGASKPTMPASGEVVETALEALWATELASVGFFDASTGILAERVWVCTGEPTSNVGGAGPYLHVGRLLQLDPDQRPDVGPSAQVAWPGQAMDGLARWPSAEE